ncbi:MAG: hypothetical protein K2X25_13170 [Caulobacteraceae bacterium]|nr:hypothetical protein [Caulobacteraceae bacterium]
MVLSSLLIALVLGPAQSAAGAPVDPLGQVLADQSRSYQFRRPSPGIHFSPRAAAAYAMASGCVPAVMTGEAATTFFSTAASGRNRDTNGRHTVSVPVSLIEGEGACTVTSADGEPEQLRDAVLAALDDLGATRTVASDSGAGSQDSNGSFRQELQCLVLDGEDLFLVMSTSSARNRPRLIASLGRDTDGGCARRAGS